MPDWGAYERHTADCVLRPGIAGVLCNGHAGENFVLSPDEKRCAFSFFLLFIKDSALASQIGVVELTYAGKALNNRGFMPLLSFGSILLLYFALSYPLAVLGQQMEKRLARPQSR